MRMGRGVKQERRQQVEEWLQNEKRAKGKEEGKRTGRNGVGWGAQRAVLSLGPMTATLDVSRGTPRSQCEV